MPIRTLIILAIFSLASLLLFIPGVKAADANYYLSLINLRTDYPTPTTAALGTNFTLVCDYTIARDRTGTPTAHTFKWWVQYNTTSTGGWQNFSTSGDANFSSSIGVQTGISTGTSLGTFQTSTVQIKANITGYTMIRCMGYDDWNSLLRTGTTIRNVTVTVGNPTYSLNSTNSTTPGSNTNFHLFWQDETALSKAMTSLWNGSEWVNATSWCSLSGNSDWCNQTFLTNIIPQTLWWKQYANDSMDNWNTSSNFSLPTVSCAGTLQPSSINFGNISVGSSKEPVGQSSTAPLLEAFNITLTGGDNCKVGIYSVGYITQNGGSYQIDPGTNEKFITNMSSTIDWGGVTSYVPRDSPTYPTNCTGVNSGHECEFYLNLTPPLGTWSGSYSGNITLVVSAV